MYKAKICEQISEGTFTKNLLQLSVNIVKPRHSQFLSNLPSYLELMPVRPRDWHWALGQVPNLEPLGTTVASFYGPYAFQPNQK